MAIRLLSWILTALFVVSGVPKLIGLEQAAQGFEQMGFPSWFRLLIGALEIAGGIGLQIPRLAQAAALGLIGIMIGAVWTMWSAGQAPIPPLVVGALLGVLAARTRWHFPP